jgi:hypothetical protein
MTTIILVIVGVLIAAVAALFIIFYGGDAFDGGTAEAEANTIVSQATQINAAYTIFRVENGRNPGQSDGSGALDELVEEDYLDSIPQRPFGAEYDAEWKIDYQKGIARTTLGRADDDRAVAVCEIARKRAGFDGSPKQCDDASLSGVDPCCVMSSADL